MAETIEGVAEVLALSSTGDGKYRHTEDDPNRTWCRAWLKLSMGLAKVADIITDWILVAKLSEGIYVLKGASTMNTTHTHVVTSKGHVQDHSITHTHSVVDPNSNDLSAVIVFAILAAVLGTIIEVISIRALQKRYDDDESRVRVNKRMAFGRLVCDDVPTCIIAIWLMLNTQFEPIDLLLLILSGGYSMLVFLYYVTRKAAKAVIRGYDPRTHTSNTSPA